MGRTRAMQINRMLRAVAARFTAVLVAEPPAIALNTVDTVSGAQTYHDAAVQILPAVMQLLTDQIVDSTGLQANTEPDPRLVDA